MEKNHKLLLSTIQTYFRDFVLIHFEKEFVHLVLKFFNDRGLSPDCSTAIAFLRSKNEVKTEVRKAGLVWVARLAQKSH